MRAHLRIAGLIVGFLACSYVFVGCVTSLVKVITDGFHRPMSGTERAVWIALSAVFLTFSAFSFSGLNLLRRRWGLLARHSASENRTARVLPPHVQADRRIRDAEASLILTPLRTGFLIVIYLTCGLFGFSALVGFGQGLFFLFTKEAPVFLFRKETPGEALIQMLLAAILGIAAGFAFSGIHALRERWGFAFSRAMYTRRFSTTDLV